MLLTTRGNDFKQVQGRVYGKKRPDGTLLFRIKTHMGCVKKRTASTCEPMVRPFEAHAVAWRADPSCADPSCADPSCADPSSLVGETNLYPRFKPSTLGVWLQNPRFLFERRWRELVEPPGVGRGDEDVFQEEAAEAIFQNFGGYCDGRGGVGKSHLLKLLRSKLEAAGWTVNKVDVIAFTHVQRHRFEPPASEAPV